MIFIKKKKKGFVSEGNVLGIPGEKGLVVWWLTLWGNPSRPSSLKGFLCLDK